MKKLLIALLAVGLLAGGYFAGTLNATKVISTPDAQWTGDSDAAAAWREFSTALEAAGERLFANSLTERDKLEGLHYLAQIAAVSLEMKFAKGSVIEPQFTDWMGDYRKFLGDSPDAIYHTAELSPDFSYEISGHRGDAEYLGVILYGRQLNGWNRAAGNLSQQTLRFDAQGNFKIVLSREQPEDPGVDWLPLENDTHTVMVRQYFHGREGKRTASFAIRNLDKEQAQPLTDSAVADGLRNAALFFTDTLDGAIALADTISKGPNNIDPPKSYRSDFGGIFYPTVDNQYFGTWFSLAEDEALILEGEVPDAPYWSVSLQNRWMQSLDYKHHQVGLNDHQITTENGRYRVVVSEQRPPSGNWLDTTGQQEGLFSIRYQQSTESEKPHIRLIAFDELIEESTQ